MYAPKKVRLIDVPEQTLDELDEGRAAGGEILFQPELACLCGSDLLFYEADYPEYQPEIGQSLHEMIGRVVATTGQKFQPGDRVLCVPVEHFGFYERFRVSEARAIPVDPRPVPEQALLAQPLGTVIFALKKIPHLLDLDVVVVGQGPMGQLFCATLRNLGARRIIAVDLLASRLEVSPRMGATHVIDASREDPLEVVRKITGGEMADLVVEAVGHREQVLNLCVDLCKPRGRVLFFGVPTEKIDGIHWRKLFVKNLTIHNSIGPSFERDFPLAMQWIAERRIDVSPIITHRMPVGEIQEAFDTFAERRDGALKVFLDM
ncbi:MAG: zinc-binding dehydrogenase [Planctomycetales bacterium]|nr:zinc-binding dehydrogenase [Planctomycetales bacterium]